MSARPMMLAGLLALAAAAPAQAQPSAAQPMTLETAVEYALTHHPRLRSASAGEEAAAARVDAARTNDWPSAGVSAELNRSTGNTVPGSFFPAPGFIPTAGPPRGRSFDGGSWQTGASLWGSWNVVSLLRQAAALDAALANRRQAQAATSAQRLEVAYGAADAFIALVAAQEAVKSAAANVERAQVLDKVVQTLVDQALRPALDGTRAHAEVAFAQTQLARAEQARDLRHAELAQALGAPQLTIETTDSDLVTASQDLRARVASDMQQHPRVREADARAARFAQLRRSAEFEYLPRVELVAALSARGSGLYGSPAAGALPDVPNWAAAVVFSWPLLDLPKDHAQARAAAADEAQALAQRDEVTLAAQSQLESAHSLLQGARRVALSTPAALTSATAAQTQARARYDAGLTSILDVADAQRALAQAELDDVTARLDVQRAALLLARAQGDLAPFVDHLRRAPGGER
ncbi:MAG TPA: TolC family protein [Polyangiales bacterium]